MSFLDPPDTPCISKTHPGFVTGPILGSPVRSREGSPTRRGGHHAGERGESIEALERLVNRTLLCTQKVTHLDILALGDELLSSKKRRRRKQEPATPGGAVAAEIMADESDDDSTDRLEEQLSVYRTLAEEDKQRALKEQEESFTKLLEEVARNRDHLEAERLEQFRRRLERERSEALQAQQKGFELEKQNAVRAACAELRLQVRREVEQERSRDVERALAAAAERFQKELDVAIMGARDECRTQAADERSKLLHHHKLEIQALHGEIAALRHQISRLHQEKKAYEYQFQEVQLNYKRFIDLTDSSLHSDYLLRLQRLGLPPGHADVGVQTDRVIAKHSDH